MSKEVQVIAGNIKQMCSDETKKQLVLESYQSGLSLNQFSKQRGISPASLCQWRKKFPAESFDSAEPDNADELRRENEALKKELFKLKAYVGHKIYELESPTFA